MLKISARDWDPCLIPLYSSIYIQGAQYDKDTYHIHHTMQILIHHLHNYYHTLVVEVGERRTVRLAGIPRTR